MPCGCWCLHGQCLLLLFVQSVFSAGLDITEMYQPDNERLAKFWEALQDLWISLYGTGMATAAAIDGHAPAGGCFLVQESPLSAARGVVAC